VRRDPYLPSRVVENLFWFGRYCERCDDSARCCGSCWRAMSMAMIRRPCRRRSSWGAPDVAAGGGRAAGAPAGGLLGDDWPFSLRQPAALAVGGLAGARQAFRENWQALVELQREALELETESRTSASCWISSTGW
jgi:uncharacterized alpha-E superfamily protein